VPLGATRSIRDLDKADEASDTSLVRPRTSREISARDQQDLKSFEVVLQMNPGETLGACLVDTFTGVLIKSVDADGVVAEWNMNNPAFAVQRGQLLLKVNGTEIATVDECKEAGLEVAGFKGEELELTFAKQLFTDEVDGFCKFCDRRAAPGYMTCCFQCKQSNGVSHSASCQVGVAPAAAPNPSPPAANYSAFINLVQAHNPLAPQSGLIESLVFMFAALVWFSAWCFTIIGSVLAVILLAKSDAALNANDPLPCWAVSAGLSDKAFVTGNSGAKYTKVTVSVNFAFSADRGLSATTTTTTVIIQAGSSFQTTIEGSPGTFLVLDSSDALKTSTVSSTLWSVTAIEQKTHAFGNVGQSLAVFVHTTSNINPSDTIRLSYYDDGSRVYAAPIAGAIPWHTHQDWELNIRRNCTASGLYFTGECGASRTVLLSGRHGRSRSFYLGEAILNSAHMWGTQSGWQLANMADAWFWVLCSCTKSQFLLTMDNANTVVDGCLWKRSDTFGVQDEGRNLLENIDIYHFGAKGGLFNGEHLCYKHPDFANNRKCDLGLGVVWLGSFSNAKLLVIISLVLGLLMCPCSTYCGVLISLPRRAQPYDPLGNKIAGILLKSNWPVTIYSTCTMLWSLCVIAVILLEIILFTQHEHLELFANQQWNFASGHGMVVYSAYNSPNHYLADRGLPAASR